MTRRASGSARTALRLASLALGLCPALAQCEGAAFRCLDGDLRHYDRKQDLPEGAEAAMGFDLAEAGASFQSTDTVAPGHGKLPWRRFISAEARGCTLVVAYERGGRGHGVEQSPMRFADGRWQMLPARWRLSPAAPPP